MSIKEKMKMNDNDEDPIETGYVMEAFEFVGYHPVKVAAKVFPPQGDRPEVVSWMAILDDDGRNLSGGYEKGAAENAHLSVITTVGIAEHVYGWLIFDLLRMAGKAIHPKSERNSVGEIAIRYIIGEAIQIMPKSRIDGHLYKVFHISENKEEAAFFHNVMNRKARKN
jgi:hypothetical protein